MRLAYRRSADRDLHNIILYVEENGGGFGITERFIDDIRRRCSRLAELPGTLGTDRGELRPGMRSTPHGNYIILFRYTADAVEIVNILHASRDVKTTFAPE